MDIYYNDLGIFLYHTPIVCSFAAAFVLLANRQRTHPQRWLAYVFIAMGVGMAVSLTFDRYLISDHREILRPVNFIASLVVAVTVLFYFVSLMQPRRLTKKFIGIICSAWLAFSLVICLLDKLSPRSHLSMDASVVTHLSSPVVIWRILIDLCVIGLDVWLGVFVLKMYRKHSQFIRDNYSFVEGINLSWVKIMMGMFILLGIFDCVWMVNSSPVFKMFFHIFSFFSIWVIFWFGFRQKEITYASLPTENWAKLDGNMQPKEKMVNLKADLLEYFDTKKPYLNPELSLQDVAVALGVSQYVLSRFINKEFEVKFYTFISHFRLEHVLHLIELNDNALNSDALLAASGFRSRSAFFTQFKEKTGYTPQEYIERKEMMKPKRGKRKKTPSSIL